MDGWDDEDLLFRDGVGHRGGDRRLSLGVRPPRGEADARVFPERTDAQEHQPPDEGDRRKESDGEPESSLPLVAPDRWGGEDGRHSRGVSEGRSFGATEGVHEQNEGIFHKRVELTEFPTGFPPTLPTMDSPSFCVCIVHRYRRGDASHLVRRSLLRFNLK